MTRTHAQRLPNLVRLRLAYFLLNVGFFRSLLASPEHPLSRLELDDQLMREWTLHGLGVDPEQELDRYGAAAEVLEKVRI